MAFTARATIAADEVDIIDMRAIWAGNVELSHAIIRGENDRGHEADLDESEITLTLHASAGTVDLAIHADDP